MPKNPIFKKLFSLYLNFFVPFFGWIITKEKGAYEYLKVSIKEFGLINVVEELKSSGFVDVSKEYLCFGSITIYSAFKETRTT